MDIKCLFKKSLKMLKYRKQNTVLQDSMEELDVKDRKILYQLDLDSRQSFSKIGKKVGLKKDLVAYRVNRLQEKGIITNFYTVIDASKFGYTYLRFYLTYQYATQGIKDEIIDYFVRSKYATFIHSVKGEHELVLVMAVKNIYEFYNFWEKTMRKYRDYFTNQIFSVFIKDNIYRHSFLLGEKLDKGTEREKFEVFDDVKVEIDDLDFQILKLIAQNARMPTIEIAKKLNTTTLTINNRIKKLMKSNIIKAFRVGIDFTKLGYQYYVAGIVLKDYKKINQVTNYLKDNPYLGEITKSLGYVDFQLEFILKDERQLHQIIEDVATKFPNTVKNYIYFCHIKSHKWNFLPEE